MELSVSPPYRDRRVGLIIFGALQIVFGGFCLLLVPLLIIAQKLQSDMTGVPADTRMMIPSAVLYGVLAMTFVTLGIGSTLCRRWARTLTLFVAWSWLICGIVAAAVMAFVLPQILKSQGLGGAGATVGFAVLGVFLFAIYIVAPAAFVLFYRSPHVRATCEARDPLPRWTDTCPFPVLGAALSFALGALSLFMMPVMYEPVFPMFGTLVTGPLGIVLPLVWGVVWVWLAWGIFRMRTWAWWASIVMIVVLGLSATITFYRIDIVEMYRAMGFPEQQLEQMAEIGLLGSVVGAVTAISVLLLLAYMLSLKKYFRGPLESEVRPD